MTLVEENKEREIERRKRKRQAAIKQHRENQRRKTRMSKAAAASAAAYHGIIRHAAWRGSIEMAEKTINRSEKWLKSGRKHQAA